MLEFQGLDKQLRAVGTVLLGFCTHLDSSHGAAHGVLAARLCGPGDFLPGWVRTAVVQDGSAASSAGNSLWREVAQKCGARCSCPSCFVLSFMFDDAIFKLPLPTSQAATRNHPHAFLFSFFFLFFFLNGVLISGIVIGSAVVSGRFLLFAQKPGGFGSDLHLPGLPGPSAAETQ